MQHCVLSPLGVSVSDLPVGPLGPAQAAELTGLLAEHGVAVIPDSPVDDAAFLDFLGSLGPLMFTTGETAVVGFPDLNVVSNVGRTTPPRSTFHVDTSYVAHPPAYTALRAVAIPAQGGQTVFSNQYRAFEMLPADVREHLAGRTVRHVVTGLDLGPEEETEAEHPIFREHPLSGRTSLYLTSPARCAAISGLDEAETAATVAMLFEHSTAPQNTYRHQWSPGDVVIWDNACVLHKADHSGVVGDRVMHRGMVAAYAP